MDYYPFGMLISERSQTFGSKAYRFGFNGMEGDDEVKGQGNSLDFGARIYDSRIGRWMSVDPLYGEYPGKGTYTFAGDMPISAYDPDGNIIIFINGYYGWPTTACCPASIDHWGDSWVSNAKKQIGDDKTMFIDGSMGGPASLAFVDEPHAGVNIPESSLSWKTRKRAGYKAGAKNAKSIIDNLSEGETIKFVTSSMGSAFQRGFSQALIDYKNDHNLEVYTHNYKAQLYNTWLKDLKEKYPEDELIQSLEEMKLRTDIIDFEIEMVVDLDPMQGENIGSDPNATDNYYALNSKTNDDYDGEGVNIMEKLIGSHVPNSTQIGQNKMKGHHPSSLPTSELPESKSKNNETN